MLLVSFLLCGSKDNAKTMECLLSELAQLMTVVITVVAEGANAPSATTAACDNYHKRDKR